MVRSTKSDSIETFAEMFHKMKESGDLSVGWANIGIAEQISLAMKQGDVTKAELARRLGKSRAYISQILQGRGANFTIETLARISHVLDCQLEVRILRKRESPISNAPYVPDDVYALADATDSMGALAA